MRESDIDNLEGVGSQFADRALEVDVIGSLLIDKKWSHGDEVTRVTDLIGWLLFTNSTSTFVHFVA